MFAVVPMAISRTPVQREILTQRWGKETETK